MVAFIPFFGLMVAFIPKIALMATIRFGGSSGWRIGHWPLQCVTWRRPPHACMNTLGWRARRVVAMAQSRLMDLVGIALLFTGLALFAAVPLLVLLRLTGGSVPRRNQRGLPN